MRHWQIRESQVAALRERDRVGRRIVVLAGELTTASGDYAARLEDGLDELRARYAALSGEIESLGQMRRAM